MKRCLAFVSLLWLLCLNTTVAFSQTPSETFRQYHLLMQVRGQETTSICMMNLQPDQSVVGTVVNEFGVKAFDFTYSQGRAKVLNVVGPLNKWYIRKVLRKDFTFLLKNLWSGQDLTEKKRTLTHQPDGTVTLRNERFKISYTFTPMETPTNETY